MVRYGALHTPLRQELGYEKYGKTFTDPIGSGTYTCTYTQRTVRIYLVSCDRRPATDPA